MEKVVSGRTMATRWHSCCPALASERCDFFVALLNRLCPQRFVFRILISRHSNSPGSKSTIKHTECALCGRSRERSSERNTDPGSCRCHFRKPRDLGWRSPRSEGPGDLSGGSSIEV